MTAPIRPQTGKPEERVPWWMYGVVGLFVAVTGGLIGEAVFSHLNDNDPATTWITAVDGDHTFRCLTTDDTVRWCYEITPAE